MMNTKHKSKYQKPKDLEKSQKPKARKDLKDYTTDDKEGKLNPKSDGAIIPNLLRKTDKPVVDDGTYDVKWSNDDRLYDDLENGDYDPKHALKKLKKREDKEEKDIKDIMSHKKEVLTKESLRDRVKKLTVEQKESLIKEYIRKKIQSTFLTEQEKEETPEVETPEIAAATDPTVNAAKAAAVDATTPEPAAATPKATTPEETPPPAETPEEQATEKQAKESVAVEKYVESLKGEGGNVARIKSIANVLNLAMQEVEAVDQANFYKLLRTLAIKKITKLSGTTEQ